MTLCILYLIKQNFWKKILNWGWIYKYNKWRNYYIFQGLTNSTINYFSKTLSKGSEIIKTEYDFVYRFYAFRAFDENFDIEYENYTYELESNLSNINKFYMLS